MIYLDNSATTQPSKVCVDTMTELLTCAWGNPSSVHALGIDAEKRLKAARAQVAQALGAESNIRRSTIFPYTKLNAPPEGRSFTRRSFDEWCANTKYFFGA